jgi:hypothetical protein
MITTAPVRPVFLVGAPRAGTALLGCCLGQHSALDPIPGGGWLGRLALHLQAEFGAGAYRSGAPPRPFESGGEARVFEAFGEVAHRLVSAGNRWVDASPENVPCIRGLAWMFPDARFLHVVRDPGSTRALLAEEGAPGSGYFTRDSADDAWLEAVRACLAAERALGPRRVHRVLHRDLVHRSEQALRLCLEFLGEEFEAACMRPLRGMGPPAEGAVRDTSRDAGRAREGSGEADALYGGIEGGGYPILDAVPGTGQEFAEAFAALALRLAGETPDGSTTARVREVIRGAVPAGSVVLVVSRGDEGLLGLEGRTAWHFPRDAEGRYAGHHPGSSSEAVRHLETQRALGAGYLAFPCTAFWWLEHYEGLRRHLEECSRIVAYQKDACLVYALGNPPGDAFPHIILSSRDLRDARRPFPAVAGGGETPFLPNHRPGGES